MSDETRQVEFIVLGSSGTHYKVTFYKKNDIFYSNCNCSAGVNGASCKHRINILIGDITSVVSPKKEDFELLKELLQGTHVGKALDDLNNFKQPKFTIDKIHPASPNERRKSIPLDLLKKTVIDGGLIKVINKIHYDIFSDNLEYIGSVKPNGRAYFSKDDRNAYFQDINLQIKEIRNQLCAAHAGTDMAFILETKWKGIKNTKEFEFLKKIITSKGRYLIEEL